ncbi:MAG: UvrD-helicase domain-containing protein, partial [Ruminococcus sp.]
MPWTSQQQDAINSTGRSVIVSASAGSGKTAVLVERVINQIINEENHIPADKIIIVTFTNNASAELRQRLNLRLQEEITKSSDSRFLLQQYTLFQNAKISTIDSFCFDIIRNNAEKLDITSGFTVLEGTKEEVMKNQAVDDTLELWSKSKPEKYSILYDRFCLKDDSGIKNVIREFDKFLESIPNRETWLDNTEKEFSKTDFRNSIYYRLL